MKRTLVITIALFLLISTAGAMGIVGANERTASSASQPIPPTVGAFAGWNSLDGQIASGSSPAVTGDFAAGDIDLVVVGGDSALWHNVYTLGSWHGWTSHGGQVKTGTSPIVACKVAGILDFFVVGADGRLWDFSDNSLAWLDLGGQVKAGTSPTVIPYNGELYVAVIGTDNSLWLRSSFSGGWEDWSTAGGQIKNGTSPSGYVTSDGQRGFAVVGTDNAVWVWNSDGWHPLGGQVKEGTSPVATGAWFLGEIDVFISSSDNSLWHKSSIGSDGNAWYEWEIYGGQIKEGSSPAIGLPGSNTLDVFVVGTDDSLWYFDGNVWTSLSGQIAVDSSPAVVSKAAGTLDVFVVGMDNSLYYKEDSGAA